LTRIDLSFLENHRSIWVVVIGLELLGLACTGLGLVSGYCYIIYAYVTMSMLWLFNPISMENRIWGDGNGTCRCDVGGLRLLSSALLESCG
jgi:hypothetical protein